MSASDSVREDVVRAFASALADIGNGAGWHATVVPTVTRSARMFSESSGPTIYIAGVREEYSRDAVSATGHYACTLTVRFVYLSTRETNDVDDQSRNRMIADVQRALRDWTLGGACTMLDITSSETVEIDPSDTLGELGVEFEAEVRYRIKRDDPATRI